MSLQVKELRGSGGMTLNMLGEHSTSRRWLVYDDDDTATLSEPMALSSYGVPEFGDQHPDWPSLVLSEFNVEKSEDRNDTYTVTGSYTLAPTQPNFNGATFSSKIRNESRRAWRRGGSVSNKDNPGRGDIGGSKIDANGEPATLWAHTQHITISHAENDIRSKYTRWCRAAGKRNAFDWGIAGTGQNFPAGSVLYIGPTIDQTGGNSYSVSHELVVDLPNMGTLGYHLRQQLAEFNADGTPAMSSSMTDGAADITADTVCAIQPFPNLIDFQVLGITF